MDFNKISFRKLIPKYLTAIFFILLALYYLWFLNKGIVLYDEGYLVEAINLIVKGKILYKDIFFQYTPLSVWLGYFWSIIFGVGIVKLRILGLFVSLFIVIVTYLISRELSVNRFISLLTAFTVFSWGFSNINFFWPSYLALLFSLLSFYQIIKYLKRGNDNNIFISGIFTALSILSRQNFGLAIFISMLLWLMFIKFIKSKDLKILRYFAGIVLVALIACLILIIGGNFSDAVNNIYLSSSKAAWGGAISSYYPFELPICCSLSDIIKKSVKLVIYEAPIIIAIIGGIYISIKKKKVSSYWMGIYLFSVIHFWMAIKPTSDLLHAIFALPPLFLLIGFGSTFNRKLFKYLSYIFLTLYTLIGFYITFKMPHYRFEEYYSEMGNRITIHRENIMTGDTNRDIVNGVTEYLLQTNSTDKVFMYPFSPMLYYITGKVPPLKYLHTVTGYFDEDEQTELSEEIEKSDVNYVIFDNIRDPEGSGRLAQYIFDNYYPVKQIRYITIYQKKQ